MYQTVRPNGVLVQSVKPLPKERFADRNAVAFTLMSYSLLIRTKIRKMKERRHV